MADDKKKAGQEVAVSQPREFARVDNYQPLFDSDRFEQMQRAAKALMHSSLVNESVRGRSAEECFSNLMVVFDISERWRMPPLSVAQEISIVHNKVVYSGKLIAAMLEASGVRLHYHYTGDRGTDDYRIYVWDRPFDQLTDEELEALAPGRYPRGARMIDGAVRDWRTFKKDGHTPNPAWTGAAQRNQLAYRGSREWARIFEPGEMLGVYGEDEIDAFEDRRGRSLAPSSTPAITANFADETPAGPSTHPHPAEASAEASPGAKADEDGEAPDTASPSEGEPIDVEATEIEDGELVEDSPFDPDPEPEDDDVGELFEEEDAQADEPEQESESGEEEDGGIGDARVEIAKVLEAIEKSKDYPAGRGHLIAAVGSTGFKGLPLPEQEHWRYEAYHALIALKGAPEMTEDPQLFRCFIPTCDSADDLEDCWLIHKESDRFKALPEAHRKGLQAVVSRRLGEIGGLD